MRVPQEVVVRDIPRVAAGAREHQHIADAQPVHPLPARQHVTRRAQLADGVHIGTVDHLEGERIKLTKADSGDGKHHYLPAGLVAAVEGDTVRLSANAANAVDLFEEAE